MTVTVFDEKSYKKLLSLGFTEVKNLYEVQGGKAYSLLSPPNLDIKDINDIIATTKLDLTF